MCLGIPGKITDLLAGGLLRMGTVDFEGVSQEVCLSYVPEAGPGDYVLVHAGFALAELDEDEARETLAALHRLAELQQLSDEELANYEPDGAGETP
ncbi:MAG: HypC/HybG/HupF family hydrogenase formation chaperone [bacterium]|nr:HypC/HybG/HupF family hydrogenase formation chaperone [bacterium]